MPNEIQMVQIIIAPFTTESGSSYSTIGLGKDGAVYRYDPQCEGWIRWSMKAVDCRLNHKGKR